MLCGMDLRFNLLGGDVFGRVSDKGSSEDRKQPVGFQAAEALAASIMPGTRRTVPIMFSIELVQASDRRSFAGSFRRLTVSISSSPSRMLAAIPGASWSSLRARLRSSRSALSASSSFQAWRSARRTDACTGLGSRSITLRALWIWYRWIGVWAPKVRRMTLLSALAPSMMNSRQTLGLSPRSIRLSISAWTTAVFSVAPSTKPSGCLSTPRAATSTRSLPICRPSILDDQQVEIGRVDAIHSASRSADSATNRREAADFEVPSPAMIGRSPSGSRKARLSLRVEHQVHGPAAKPVLRLRRRPARQRNFMTIEAAHPRPMHRNLAAVEADLALRRAPAVAHPASAAAVRRACELLPVLAQHLFDGSNPSRQTEALK